MDQIDQFLVYAEEVSGLPRASLALYGILAAIVGQLVSIILAEPIPEIEVEITELEASDIIDTPIHDPSVKPAQGEIPCYDPGTMMSLGTVPAMTADQVCAKVERAKEAQKIWATSSFNQRRKLLKIIQRYILDHQELICRVAARDSGKPMVDAAFGEVLVTCEKIKWLLNNGEKYLKPETRPSGYMMMHKVARVEYKPVGVMGCIVPWNYPFHNVFNPLVANVFAGNAIVIKVSEYASWSVGLYGRIIAAALEAAGAPTDLVQIVTGYGEAGNALVTSPSVSKVVFVGSTAVGKKVMEAAAVNLTPVVLELGGKDPFIVCDDADLKQLMPFAMRGTFQSMGQNCTGAERFIVQEGIHDRFVDAAVKQVMQMRVGPALGGDFVDCGALVMPNHALHLQALVDDAVSKGARALTGGHLPPKGTVGQFYPPTVLVDVTSDMRLWKEEVFGPILPVFKVKTDAEAIAVANDCAFGLGSSVFSNSQGRARAIGDKLEAGMTSLNDFAATYMSQALPFGGVKDSGFDRFAGIEGLRGCCYVKSVCEDRAPWLMKTNIPPLLQYPVNAVAFDFVSALCKLFYGFSLVDRLGALVTMAQCFLFPSSLKKKEGVKNKAA